VMRESGVSRCEPLVPSLNHTRSRRSGWRKTLRKGGVPKRDRIQTFCDRESDGRGRLASRCAGAVIAPVGRGAIRVDEREFELTASLEVDPADRHPALVVQ